MFLVRIKKHLIKANFPVLRGWLGFGGGKLEEIDHTNEADSSNKKCG